MKHQATMPQPKGMVASEYYSQAYSKSVIKSVGRIEQSPLLCCIPSDLTYVSVHLDYGQLAPRK
jgi:hypothetical protein